MHQLKLGKHSVLLVVKPRYLDGIASEFTFPHHRKICCGAISLVRTQLDELDLLSCAACLDHQRLLADLDSNNARLSAIIACRGG